MGGEWGNPWRRHVIAGCMQVDVCVCRSSLFALESRLVAAGRGSPVMAGQALVECLRASGMPLLPEDYAALLQDLDPRGRGNVDARQFLENLRVRRRGVVTVRVCAWCAKVASFPLEPNVGGCGLLLPRLPLRCLTFPSWAVWSVPAGYHE